MQATVQVFSCVNGRCEGEYAEVLFVLGITNCSGLSAWMIVWIRDFGFVVCVLRVKLQSFHCKALQGRESGLCSMHGVREKNNVIQCRIQQSHQPVPAKRTQRNTRGSMDGTSF